MLPRLNRVQKANIIIVLVTMVWILLILGMITIATACDNYSYYNIMGYKINEVEDMPSDEEIDSLNRVFYGNYTDSTGS